MSEICELKYVIKSTAQATICHENDQKSDINVLFTHLICVNAQLYGSLVVFPGVTFFFLKMSYN